MKEQEQIVKQLVIPEDILQAVINYITTKPFNEVNGLIEDIQKNVKVLTTIPEPEKEEAVG